MVICIQHMVSVWCDLGFRSSHPSSIVSASCQSQGDWKSLSTSFNIVVRHVRVCHLLFESCIVCVQRDVGIQSQLRQSDLLSLDHPDITKDIGPIRVYCVIRTDTPSSSGVEPDCGGGDVLIDTEWLPRNHCCQGRVSTKSVPSRPSLDNQPCAMTTNYCLSPQRFRS